MAEPDKRPVTLEELLVSSLAQTDALAMLLKERATYQRLLKPIMQMRAGKQWLIRD